MEKSVKSPVKDKYKVVNWKTYTKSLKKRGQLSLWIDASLLREWKGIYVRKKVVGEKLYPDRLIEFCLTIGIVYHQKLRQSIGFIESIFAQLGLSGLCIPDYSTLSRRGRDLPIGVSTTLEKGKLVNISVDSTGLKVFGEGEWKVRKHGASKRRTWRKLHLGIDVDTQEILVVGLTNNSIDDGAAAIELLSDKVSQLKSFRGDGGYDDKKVRMLLGQPVQQIIPPPTNAVLQKQYVRPNAEKQAIKEALQQRDQAILSIKATDRKTWKQTVAYHRRSLSETCMFRYKNTFTANLSAKTDKRQLTEVKIKCKILNKFNQCGMPVSQKI